MTGRLYWYDHAVWWWYHHELQYNFCIEGTVLLNTTEDDYDERISCYHAEARDIVTGYTTFLPNNDELHRNLIYIGRPVSQKFQNIRLNFV